MQHDCSIATAIMNKDFDLAKELISKKNPIDSNMTFSMAGLMGNCEIMQLLIDNYEYTDKDIKFALYQAIKSDNGEKIDQLIPYQKSLDSFIEDAASLNRLDLIKRFMALGAKIPSDSRALRLAAQDNHIDVVKFLLENGTEDKERALISAVDWGRSDIIQLLLENGADIKKAIQFAEQNARYTYIIPLLQKLL